MEPLRPATTHAEYFRQLEKTLLWDHAYSDLISFSVALVKGDVSNGDPVLVRVHSECLTGDVFGSCRSSPKRYRFNNNLELYNPGLHMMETLKCLKILKLKNAISWTNVSSVSRERIQCYLRSSKSLGWITLEITIIGTHLGHLVQI